MTMMSLRMGSPSSSFNFNQKNMGEMGDVITDDDIDHDEEFGAESSVSSSINSSSISGDDDDVSSSSSSEVERGDEASSSVSGEGEAASDSLQDMSSLMQQLPFKRGLSKYFQGKSQSFTSLANVRSLEDLPKQEHPYNKKLKSCKSYALFSSDPQTHFPRTCSSSKLIAKKMHNHLSARRNPSFLGLHRPPVPSSSPRSTSTNSFQNHTPLFA